MFTGFRLGWLSTGSAERNRAAPPLEKRFRQQELFHATTGRGRGRGVGGKGGEAEVQIFTAYRACARVPERSSRWARRPLLFVPNVLTFSPSIKKRDRYMRQETAGGGKGRGTGRRRAKERCSERGMRVKGSGGGP